MPTPQLYPFRFRDPLTDGWIRARHRMQVPEMQRQYSEWKITGVPEIRHVTAISVQAFNPFEPARRRYHRPYATRVPAAVPAWDRRCLKRLVLFFALISAARTQRALLGPGVHNRYRQRLE
jgi:hypothetical protein